MPEPSKPVAVPVAAPLRAIVRLAASLVALAALPVVLTEAVPVSFDASSDVTGIAMLAVPSQPVAVPVAAPDRAIVRLAASYVADAELPDSSTSFCHTAVFFPGVTAPASVPLPLSFSARYREPE